MAKTNEEILEAVRGLDPQNDEHWTADGLPRLDAVENLLGTGVTRKAVTNSAPDFSRTVASELVEAPEDGEPPVDEPPVESDETEADQSSPEDETEAGDASATDPDLDNDASVVTDPDEDENDGDDPLAEGPADIEAELDAKIFVVQECIGEIQRHLEEGKKALAQAEHDLGQLVDEKNRQFPPITQAAAIQQFQRNEQAKRAAARGVGHKNSPLDAALTARRKVRRQGSPKE